MCTYRECQPVYENLWKPQPQGPVVVGSETQFFMGVMYTDWEDELTKESTLIFVAKMLSPQI